MWFTSQSKGSIAQERDKSGLGRVESDVVRSVFQQRDVRITTWKNEPFYNRFIYIYLYMEKTTKS